MICWQTLMRSSRLMWSRHPASLAPGFAMSAQFGGCARVHKALDASGNAVDLSTETPAENARAAKGSVRG